MGGEGGGRGWRRGGGQRRQGGEESERGGGEGEGAGEERGGSRLDTHTHTHTSHTHSTAAASKHTLPSPLNTDDTAETHTAFPPTHANPHTDKASAI